MGGGQSAAQQAALQVRKSAWELEVQRQRHEQKARLLETGTTAALEAGDEQRAEDLVRQLSRHRKRGGALAENERRVQNFQALVEDARAQQ